MLPPSSTLKAAQRWISLLKTSSTQQAAGLLRSHTQYADLSDSQYAAGYNWLLEHGFLHETTGGTILSSAGRRLGGSTASVPLFAKALESTRPNWLPDADALVTFAGEIPDDARTLGESIGLTGPEIMSAIRSAWRHVNHEKRVRIGLAGELALVEALEERWPGSTTHVSQISDSYGYDIRFQPHATAWHLEVKSTRRRGRLTIHLSRSERDVASADPNWRLIAIGLRHDDELAAVATINSARIITRSPKDTHPASRWESTAHDISAHDLTVGLDFLPDAALDNISQDAFAWMPTSQ